MRKKHQLIYDNGYTQALRDLSGQINERGGVSKENLIAAVLDLMKPIRERYNLDE